MKKGYLKIRFGNHRLYNFSKTIFAVYVNNLLKLLPVFKNEGVKTWKSVESECTL